MGERLRVLAVDVGTGTQDILLFDSDKTIENCFQLIMPSPTVMVAERIHRATAQGRPVLLTGRTMGGGPSGWAARDHAQAGFPCYATADAARTLDDDLTAVTDLGLTIVDDAEAQRLLAMRGTEIEHIVMRDFDGAALQSALAVFGIDTAVDVVAVAAFDHGAAPPGYSDRRFRFEYIEEAVRQRPDAAAFAYPAQALPPDLTRLAAIVEDAATYRMAGADYLLPVYVMDTGAAALLGALDDEMVRAHDDALIVNIGNFHTLAFHVRRGRILSLFEHHTGLLDRVRLEDYLAALTDGSLTNERVFEESGHGALILEPREAFASGQGRVPFLAVTGPRREILRGSALQPYEAVPHGDMMLAGCFGLLRALAALDERYAAPVERVLGPALT